MRILSVGGAIFLLWLVYRKMAWEEIVAAFSVRSTHYGILLGTVLLEILAAVLRGLRWQLQMRPLATTSPRALTVALSVLGNYTINMMVPRGGDVWRCVVVGRKEKLSIPQLLGTMLIDRLMDGVCLFLVVLLALASLSGLRSYLLVEHNWLAGRHGIESPTHIVLYGLPVLLVVVLLIFFLRRSHLASRLRQWLRQMIEGVRAFRAMPRKGLFIYYSIAIWGLYFLAFYFTFFAFEATSGLSPWVALYAFVLGSIGIAAPVQGGIGAWHFMVISALVAFGVSQTDAAGFAIVVHAVQQLGLALAGCLAIVFLQFIPARKE